jgi:hypothetical protein
MNTPRDFHKRADGVVVNTNTGDHTRARRRNRVRKEQDVVLGANGKIAKLEAELAELKALILAK